jgi:hypothetical protein
VAKPKKKAKKKQPERNTSIRKLQHKMPALKARLLYLCEHLVGGKIPRFAAGLNLHPAHLYHSLRSVSGVSAGVLAQVVSFTNVRAEWLLCGAGPMFRDDPAPHVETNLVIPACTQSQFPLLDTATLSPTPVVFIPCRHEVAAPSNAALAAGQAVYRAGVARAASVLFLGCGALAKAAPASIEFLQRGYLTAITLTSAAVQIDAPNADIAAVAHMGAMQGTGLGEALGRWGFTTPSGKSVLYTAMQRALPAPVLLSFGDAAAHYAPALRGAEFGAALGATAYVDMLLFAEQIRHIHGGVFIVAGDIATAEPHFREAVYVASRLLPAPPMTGFSVIVLGHEPSLYFKQFIQARDGVLYHIPGTYEAALEELLSAVSAAYDGVTA